MQTKSPHRPRLDLLRFPSDTGLRVALLIAAALGTSLFAYQWLSLGLLRTAFLRAAQACERVGGSISTVKACLQPAERMQAGLIMLGLVLLIGVAGAIFWAYPHMIIRRKRLMAYDPASMPDLTATLAELFTQAQLSHPPRVLLDPLGRAGGWVFGRARARYLVLPGGLLATFLNDPAAFRAVVRHELAHLANRDVDLTFLSLSTWYAVGLVALAPLSLSLLAEVLRADAGPLALGVLLRAAALALVVRAALAGVLRAREVEADLRAATWDGAGGALRRALEALPAAGHGLRQRLLAWHPAPAFRRRMLDDSTPLLQLQLGHGLSAGLIAALALPELITLADLLLPANREQGASVVAALPLALLLAGTVGLPIWRAAVAAQLGAGPAPRATPLGLGLGLGVLGGLLLSFTTSVRLPPAGGATAGDLVFVLACAGVLTLGLTLWARMLIDTASLWIGRITSARSLARCRTLALALSGLLLAIWLGALAELFGWGWAGVQILLGRASPAAITMRLLSAPLTQILLIGLWLLPVVALLRPPAPAGALDWAVQEAQPQDAAPGLRLRTLWAPIRVVSIGLIVLLLLVRLLLRLALPEAARATELARLWFVGGQIGLAVLAQIAVAFTIASRAGRAGWALGMAAAWLVGWVASLAATALVQAGYCLDALAFSPGHSCAERVDGALLWLFAGPITQMGAVALIAAWAGMLLAGRAPDLDRAERASSQTAPC